MKARTTVKPLAVLLVLCFGIWWGGHPSQMPGFMRSIFVANSHDTVISEALSDIQHDYFRPISRGGLINGSISGAVASLRDPYAAYETPAAYNAFTNPKPQSFAGIGITVDPTSTGLVVEAVLPGAPAARAGIHAGDLITAVGRRRLAGLPSAVATSLIKGRPGTPVTLAITRGSHHLTLTLKRATIDTPLVYDTVTSYRGVKIGLLDLPTFDVPGIHGEVASDLQSLLQRHVRAIVLDLRNNPGGLVTEAQLIASLFIAHGKIVTTRGRVQVADTLYATGHPLAPSLPMAVLVNGDTASAAEIVTGALQDHHRAVVVGTHTYGKGVFQEIHPLPNGGAIQYTVGEYFLPSGRNLGAGGFKRGAGITPNVIVNAPPTATADPQLRAALRLLAAKAS